MKTSKSELNNQLNSADIQGNLHNPSDTPNSSELLPDNQESATPCKRDRENLLIDSLLASRKVTGWDATFLRTLREKKKRSPRQQAILQSIAEKVGGAS